MFGHEPRGPLQKGAPGGVHYLVVLGRLCEAGKDLVGDFDVVDYDGLVGCGELAVCSASKSRFGCKFHGCKWTNWEAGFYNFLHFIASLCEEARDVWQRWARGPGGGGAGRIWRDV